MAIRQLDIARSYLFPPASEREASAQMYRPLVRGYFLVVIGYYLIAGICVAPFLESGRVLMTMIPLRLSVSALALAAFWLTRGTESGGRLELATLLVNLHIFINFFINQSTEFRPEIMSNFEVFLVLFGATSPSLRVAACCEAVSIGGWLWLVGGPHPELLKACIALSIVGFVVGITIWSLIQSALRSAAKALVMARQRGDELERFAYICSHDMQEPVRMMNIYAELLGETASEKLDIDDRNYLGFIRENAVRLQRMIADILAFSRIGKDDVKIERVDTGAVLDEVLDGLEDVIRQKGATVTHAGLPVIETNPTLMRVLFQNLVGNALKYTGKKTAPQVTISARAEKAGWRFEVRDNGIGIDPRYRDKVFTLFQRLNRKEDYPGSGIGLSSCRKFLAVFGGEIDFDSAPGAGSCFIFTLPSRRPKHDATA